jgi:hypothetical protein
MTNGGNGGNKDRKAKILAERMGNGECTFCGPRVGCNGNRNGVRKPRHPKTKAKK